MGHFHSTNLDRVLLDLMYAKGKVSINDAVAMAQKKGEVFHASEGTYDHKHMLQSGIQQLVWIHFQAHQIEAVLETDEQKLIYHKWLKDALDYEFDDDGEDAGELAILDTIKFKFAPGFRNQFKHITITEVES